MTKATMIFFICLGIYFVGLATYSIIKKVRANRKFKNDKKEIEDKQDEIK